jgi:NhaP-type Na+/H+ or K+/H+ antiporter
MTGAAAAIAVMIVLYAAFAARLAGWWISMPMVFVATGFLLGPSGAGILVLSLDAEGVKELTELTLALLLFADASTLHLRQVRHDVGLPLRLLSVGLLLTMVCGTMAALGLLFSGGLALAALLGAILAPTDAALGLPIFNNPRVPVRIRRALNVESGLNDGIATPFVTLFIGYATAAEGLAPSSWLSSAVLAVVLAVVMGGAVGVLGGWLLTQAASRGWTSSESMQLAIFGLGLLAYFAALAIGANGFIAAFVAGLAFSAVTRNRFAEPTAFTDTFSTVLSLIVWVIFGAVLVTDALRYTADWRPIAFAVLSLTLVRMVPVALAMVGTGLRADTVLLMGWFGPRGLASVVFTLVALLELEAAGQAVDTLVLAATWTILLSVVAHGLTAQPLSEWYAARLSGATGQLAELLELPELDGRRRSVSS